jgi:hypothetical protein
MSTAVAGTPLAPFRPIASHTNTRDVTEFRDPLAEAKPVVLCQCENPWRHEDSHGDVLCARRGRWCAEAQPSAA